MRSKFELGRRFGLRLTAGNTAFVGFAGIWTLTFTVALTLLEIPPVAALIGGLACALLHFLLELVHQLGHASAARATGYPMTGIHFWLVLGLSVYPRDEPNLPGRIHIRRAMGGPLASLLISVPLGLIALALRPWDTTPGWIVAFAFLDSFLFFTVGALLPLGFTDGSTILRWWGK